MIVYQALSTYQILECIEHKYIYHSNEEAILILGNYIVEKFPHYRKLAEYHFFNDVFLFNFGGVRPEENVVIETIGQRLKDSIPINIEEADKIYIAGIHTYLALYLISKNIKFAMFEDGSGALSRPWILANITKKSTPEKYKLINQYGLYDHSSDLIIEKWCNKKTQIEGFEDDKAKNFDVVEGFQKLDDISKNDLLKFFGVDKKISVPVDSTLVLTQQFSNLGQLSFEEHVNIYQYLFDFYINKKNEDIILKLHPDDILYYKKLFPKVHTVREMFPSELLPYVFTDLPQNIVTISSTGIHLIQDEFENSMVFNELYEKTFVYDPIYFFVANFLDVVNVNRVCCWGCNQKQLQNMVCTNVQDKIPEIYDATQSTEGDILIIDDYSETDMPQFDNDKYFAILYLNTKKKYLMCYLGGKNVFENMFPIKISLEPYIQGENGLEKKSFIIWLQLNDERARKAMEEIKIEKDLKNSGAILKVDTFTDEEMEIMRLKGLLEATEKRLIDYIQREHELNEQIKLLQGEDH